VDFLPETRPDVNRCVPWVMFQGSAAKQTHFIQAEQ
jgi:hypothetical protein